jgi:hypothetical protein
MDYKTPRVIQQTRVIVGDHRRNAARSKLAPTMSSVTPYFETYFVPCGLSSFACNIPHSRRMIE